MPLKQPNLGTAMILLLDDAVMFFIAGVRSRFFILVMTAATTFMAIAWQFLRDYQTIRIYTFFNPANNPFGAGYHILQSEIVLSFGSLFGKGFPLGTQNHLSVLPGYQTDIILDTFFEEVVLLEALSHCTVGL